MDAERMNQEYDRLLAKARTTGVISDPPSEEYNRLVILAAALNRPIRWQYRITRLYGDAQAQGVK